jgi:TolB protein
MRLTTTLTLALLAALSPKGAVAQDGPPPPADESVLGEILVAAKSKEHVIKLAVLPSLAPDMEDVVVRGVVRRDLELIGLFDVIDDRKAPPGLYGFDDPVDLPAWRSIGAEVIVKVNARKQKGGKVQVSGLAYFTHVGQDPVYQKTLTVAPKDVRITAHRVTDALLGAITGRDGGFASQLTYAAPWGRDRRVLTMDADGHELTPRTETGVAIAPVFGPGGALFASMSHNYAPFELVHIGKTPKKVDLPFRTSIYSAAFDDAGKKVALAVAEPTGSAIYVGEINGQDFQNFQKVSTTELATHPKWSPSGKLAWVGGGKRQGTQRIYVDGKAVSPAGFTASSPVFCDTEDGIRLVYAVAVGGERQDLILSGERGGGNARLTQNQGSNSYPACSPDGRLLAFFSTRQKKNGIYVLSLKRWGTQQLSSQYGESLRWARRPAPVPEK